MSFIGPGKFYFYLTRYCLSDILFSWFENVLGHILDFLILLPCPFLIIPSTSLSVLNKNDFFSCIFHLHFLFSCVTSKFNLFIWFYVSVDFYFLFLEVPFGSFSNLPCVLMLFLVFLSLSSMSLINFNILIL